MVSMMESKMRLPMPFLSAAIAGAVLCSSAIAAPAPSSGTHGAAPPVVRSSAPSQPDCQKTGSDVSALIDQRKDSPNIAAARSVFQIGIMECMEGSDDAANQHYADAKTLLNGQPAPTGSIRLPSP
jgi:hypothetical protein